MATKIKIGHASISENNTAYGTAGDQNGNEVCINENFTIIGSEYSLNPNVVLRPNTPTLAEKSAEACEAGCLNDHIGYSQNRRNSLNERAKEVGYDLSKITADCDTDCSAFLTVCAIAGGSKIAYGSNAPTTTNMRTRFKQSGDYSVLTDSKHLTITDYLKRGDILVCEGSHTVMVLENGSSVVDDEDTGTTGVTPVTIIKVRAIEVALSKINKNSAVASVKILEQKTGVAAKLLGIKVVRNYTLSYILEQLGGSTNTKQIKVVSNQLSLTLNNLQPNTSYMLRVIAEKDGEVAFCSQKVLFTTPPEKDTVNNTKKEFTAKASKAVDHVYIKTEDKFSPVIIYKNEV